MAINHFKVDSVQQLVDYLDNLLIGKIKIVYQDESKIILEEDECAVCSGFPNIGESLCSFESGFIAGGLSSILKKDVKVTETKCWGLGDEICRFEAEIRTVDSKQDESVDTFDLIASLASKASTVIEVNKELNYKNEIFNKQLEFAQNIQKKIIPHKDTFDSNYYKFYSYLKPFRKVGGDFYDFFKLEHEKMGIAIADMAGHGIDAAMITSMVKLILKHCSKRKGLLQNPSKVMEYVENDILEVIPDNFFSMIYMVLDPIHNSISYSNAGHPSAILYRKNKNIIQLLHPNLPLVGLSKFVEDYSFIQQSVLYENGDQLFLYTDGVPETRNTKGQFYNTNTMLDIIRDSRDFTVDEVCIRIINSLNEHRSDKDEDDDVCLIGIQL
nr:SpoIIE family protein phosphatase [Alkalibaculum sporogenes]